MFFGDVNFIFFIFFLLLSSLIINTNTSLHLLLTAELLWVTLYALVLLIGFSFNNLTLVSLTFFFLIFSAIELGIGLVLSMLQHNIFRTMSLSTMDQNLYKYSNRINRFLNINSLNYKI